MQKWRPEGFVNVPWLQRTLISWREQTSTFSVNVNVWFSWKINHEITNSNLIAIFKEKTLNPYELVNKSHHQIHRRSCLDRYVKIVANGNEPFWVTIDLFRPFLVTMIETLRHRKWPFLSSESFKILINTSKKTTHSKLCCSTPNKYWLFWHQLGR